MAAPNVYPITTVQLYVEFRNGQRSLYDPSVVTVYFQGPDGTTEEFSYPADAEVVKTDTGQYYCDMDADLAGYWYYRWDGDGAAQESYVQIVPSLFAP